MAGREAELGKAMAKIALECGIEHFMFSTQPDPRSESKGKYNVPSFSDKAEVHKFASTLPFKYHTYLAPSFYFQNWDEICCPFKEADGVFTYKLPISDKAFISAFDVEELGQCALNAFLNPLAWGNGEVVPLVASHMHPSEYFGIIEQHSGQKIRFESVSCESFVKCAERCHMPAGKELAEWFRWINDYGYFGSKYNISDGHKLLGRPMKTFRQWVKDTNFKITHWQNMEGGGIMSDKGVETFHGSRIGHSAAAGSKFGEHGRGVSEREKERGLPVESGVTSTTTSEGIGAGHGRMGTGERESREHISRGKEHGSSSGLMGTLAGMTSGSGSASMSGSESSLRSGSHGMLGTESSLRTGSLSGVMSGSHGATSSTCPSETTKVLPGGHERATEKERQQVSGSKGRTEGTFSGTGTEKGVWEATKEKVKELTGMGTSSSTASSSTSSTGTGRHTGV
jgi:hypothetical protein